MNWGQFKRPLWYLCLAGAVVTLWSLIQEVVGLNNLFNHICVTEFNKFSP